MVIYLIKNTINNKIYVGKTVVSLRVRWNAHKCAAKNATSKMLISKAIKKYGPKNFFISVLEFVGNKKDIDQRELYWINRLNSNNLDIGYNVSLGVKDIHKIRSANYSPRFKFRGLNKRGNKYCVSIRHNYKKVESKGFSTIEEAAEAYDRVSLFLRGENTFYLNFPDKKQDYLKENLELFYKNYFLKKQKYSSFIGITFHKNMKKWTARFASKIIGNYSDELSAAKARDEYVIKNGLMNKTKLNFT